MSAWMVDMERFFELVVFNYIYANGDDHLKNFSLVLQGEDYRLAPAYDLLNTSLHVLRAKKILDKYVSLPEKSLELIDRSCLPDKLKRKYIRIVNERIARFVRESE